VAAVLTACTPLRAQEAQADSGPDKPAAVAAPNKSDDSPSGEDATALAKKLQNPIGDLYNIPFQSNTNFDVGPNHGTQEILNIQPVIPFHINEDWNIITRTIVPIIWNPSFQPEHTVPQGIGPTTFSAFLSPRNPTDGWLWGVGPVVQIPTVSDPSLGSNIWGLGPSCHRQNGWPDRCWRTHQQCVFARRHDGLWRHTLWHVPDAALLQL
jgi:hypothetical protein